MADARNPLVLPRQSSEVVDLSLRRALRAMAEPLTDLTEAADTYCRSLADPARERLGQHVLAIASAVPLGSVARQARLVAAGCATDDVGDLVEHLVGHQIDAEAQLRAAAADEDTAATSAALLAYAGTQAAFGLVHRCIAP